jgi:hypothetical protein
MKVERLLNLRSGAAIVFVAVLAGWWIGARQPAEANARSRKSEPARVPMSFAYDWGGSSEVATLYTVPKGHRLVITDCQGFWWYEGAAQRFILYQGVEPKGAFLASSRGRKGTNGYTAFDSGWHSMQGGIVFDPGTDLRVIPSTTYQSVTVAGYLDPI